MCVRIYINIYIYIGWTMILELKFGHSRYSKKNKNSLECLRLL